MRESSHRCATDDRVFAFEIAGLRIAVRSVDPRLRLEASSVLRTFLVEPDGADVQLDAYWDEIPKPGGPPLFDSGGVWSLYDSGNRIDVFCCSPVLSEQPYKRVSFDHALTHGEIRLNSQVLDPASPVDPLEYPLDELLTVHLLSLGRGVEIHAAGVVDAGGAGYLFAGQSGAGKSTISRCWLGAGGTEVLNDDRIILRRVDGRVKMYGTPWHGEGRLWSNGVADPIGIFFLEGGGTNMLRRRSGADAVARLLARAFPPFYSAAGMDFTLEFLDETAEAVPCFDLSFVPDPRVADWLRRDPRLGGGR